MAMALPKIQIKLTPRVRKILTYVGYGAFYWLCLVVFFYMTFPYERLRDRVIREFNARQTGPDALKLELDEISGYFLSGIEADGIRLVSPPKPAVPGAEVAAPVPVPVPAPSASGSAAVAAKGPAAGVLTIDSAHARVSLLPLLFGSVRVNFGADAFGGSISGTTSESDGTRRLELELEDLGLDKATLLSDIVGLPMAGTLAGTVEFALPEGKLAKADGKVALSITQLSAGDGKAKIRDTIALPKVEAGDITLEGEATSGTLKITKFTGAGPDLDLGGEGSVRLRDPAQSSLATLAVRFRFADRYTGKSEMTRGIFGAPGSSVPGLFDLDPKNKRAKSPDGFYGWRLSGPFSQLQFTPHAGAAAGTGAKR